MASNTTTTTTVHNARFNAEAAAWDSNPDVHRASDGALQALLSTYSSPPPPPSSSSSPAARDPGGLALAHIHLTPTDPQTDVLEIGCGTGLLSFRLAPYVRSILAVDAAPGMISALEAKLGLPPAADDTNTSSTTTKNDNGPSSVAEGTPPNHRDPKSIITPLCILLEDAEDPRLPPSPSPSPSTTTTKTTTPPPRKKFDLITSHLTLHHIPPPSLPRLLQTMLAALKPGGQVALTDYQDVGPEARKFHPEGKMPGVESPRGIEPLAFAALLREVGFVDVDVSTGWVMGEKEVERFPGEWGADGVKPTVAGDGAGELAKMDFPFLLCRGTKGVAV